MHHLFTRTSFSQCSYALVWEETTRVYKDMVACEGWLDKDVVDVPVVQVHTFKVRIYIRKANHTK